MILIRHFVNEHEVDLEHLYEFRTIDFLFYFAPPKYLCLALGNYTIRRSFFHSQTTLINFRQNQFSCVYKHVDLELCLLKELLCSINVQHSFYVALFKHDQKVFSRTSRCNMSIFSHHTNWVDICILVCFIGFICILW